LSGSGGEIGVKLSLYAFFFRSLQGDKLERIAGNWDKVVVAFGFIEGCPEFEVVLAQLIRSINNALVWIIQNVLVNLASMRRRIVVERVLKYFVIIEVTVCVFVDGGCF